jgi:branched-chain amino acid transport system substrate-binding protein
MTKRKVNVRRRSFLANTARVAAAVAATGAAGGILSRHAFAANEPIRIGHQCDLTGALASTGYWRKKATDAVATWLNQSGGIAGRPIEVITVDTETKVDVGVSRLRQLIQENKVDFVIGSQHGGIGVASNPVVRELNTIYMPLNRTDATTGSAANPFVFRLMVNTSLTANAAGGWMTQNIGKRWGVVHADYIWGQSHRDAWSQVVGASGGKVLQSIAMPVNTTDPLPYLGKIDRSADAIFLALLGPDVPRSVTALRQIGLGSKALVTADYIFGSFDVVSLGATAEGLWGMDTLPWELADRDTPHLRNMRKVLGVDDRGREAGSGRFCSMGEIWPAWENLGFIKQNVEGSAWKSRADNAKFIRHAEANPKYAESALFPQGELLVRPEDHQGFVDYFLLRVEQGRIRVKNRVPKQAGTYPATVRLNKA